MTIRKSLVAAVAVLPLLFGGIHYLPEAGARPHDSGSGSGSSPTTTSTPTKKPIICPMCGQTINNKPPHRTDPTETSTEPTTYVPWVINPNYGNHYR